MTKPAGAALVLADGSVFEGEAIGAPAQASGEVVFNTALCGYQEVVTDPSYAGQVITFTYPHIGNYGTNSADNESRGTFARGVVVRDLARRHSNYRAEEDLDGFLRRHGMPGIAGLDTRRLTRLLRTTGAMPGSFAPVEGDGAVDLATLTAAAAAEPGTNGVDLVSQVTTAEPYTVGLVPGAVGPDGAPAKRIVAFDFGIKTTILDHLGRFASVEVVPASTSAADVLARQVDGVFLSNGPGDPEMNPGAIEAIKGLVGNVPVFGICLGHQLLSLAIGGEMTKLPFGHHGANHPVRDVTTNKVEITSQNHNFAVLGESIADVADVTHVNLNDGVCEGMSVRGERAFSVQHHPEASPGPHDSAYLFDRFNALMNNDTMNGTH